jgi:tRNA uracil 4-sulfurtransferase
MKLIALLSGGIDSPVASILALKKGIEVHAIHFSPASLISKSKEDKMNKLAETIKKYGTFHYYTCPFKEIQKSVIIYTQSNLRMLIYRRLMFRIGEKLLEKIKADGFLTGDSLGQVASQTTENIRTLYSATKKETFTPLIGKNKEEIIKLAKEFRTYEISTLAYEDCCSFMIAEHPELKSTRKKLEETEKKIPKYDELIKKAKIEKIF